jgi:hypothetical protein
MDGKLNGEKRSKYILGFHLTSREGQGSVSRVKDGFYIVYIGFYSNRITHLHKMRSVAEILVGRGVSAPPPPRIFGNFDLKEG